MTIRQLLQRSVLILCVMASGCSSDNQVAAVTDAGGAITDGTSNFDGQIISKSDGAAGSGVSKIVNDNSVTLTKTPYAVALRNKLLAVGMASCAPDCVSLYSLEGQTSQKLGTVTVQVAPVGVYSLAFIDGQFLAVGTNSKVHQLNYQDPNTPYFSAEIMPGGENEDIVLRNGHLAVASANFGIWLVDSIATPPELKKVTEYDPPTPNPWLRTVDVVGDLLFTGGFSSEKIWKVSLANINAPALIKEKTNVLNKWGANLYKLRVVSGGTKVAVAGGAAGLIIFNLDLTELGRAPNTLDNSNSPITDLVEVATNQILVAEAKVGLRLLDISDPAKIVERMKLEDADGAWKLAYDPTTKMFAYLKAKNSLKVVYGHWE